MIVPVIPAERAVSNHLDEPITEKRCIVMPSIGERAWNQLTSATFRRYAHKCNADFYLVTHEPQEMDTLRLHYNSSVKGRANKSAYALKSFLAWKYLADYDRVLIVDDTCVVTDYAPDIFSSVPNGNIAGKGTAVSHAALSFASIKALRSATTNRSAGSRRVWWADRATRVLQKMFREKEFISRVLVRVLRLCSNERARYDSRMYFNTGVMLYDSTLRWAFSPDRLRSALPLLYNSYPHQTLSYFLIAFAESPVPIVTMDRRFNRVPGAALRKSERIKLRYPSRHVECDEHPYIYHVTGAYHYRSAVIEDLAHYFLKRWDGELD